MSSVNPARADLLETFALDVAMVRGTGTRLFDEQGREYLDALAQYGALPFGHNPPELWDALMAARQAEMPAMVQPLRPVAAERLADRLAEITPGDLAITTFTNSGAETVEAAIKLARVRTGRDRILSTWNGFHGKTLGALSATGKPLYQKDFAAPAPGFDYVPFGDLAALEARLEAEADQIAAFVVEPIQGEGGVVVPPEGYLDGVIALCRKYGVLSIVDEIQTGLGRTGALFACSEGSEVPDMLLLAKALGGGMMPIGACIVRPAAWDDRFGRLHSSTFANNNLACTVALAALDKILADDAALIGRVRENGARFRARLEALATRYPEVIREVRGRGYMMGLEFHPFDTQRHSATMAFSSLNGGVTALISSHLLNVHGILTAPLFNESHVMRLQPPLIATADELDRVATALEAVCDLLARRDYYTLVRHLAAEPRDPVGDDPRTSTEEVAPSRQAEAPVPGRFAFLVHYTQEEDIVRCDPSFGQFDETELVNWQNWMKRLGPGDLRRIPNVTSKTGATAEGKILFVPMLPRDMQGRSRAAATAMIKEAVDRAAGDGATRVGLGAFTSIVTRGGETVTGRGVPMTSGNTLTTVAAVQGIENVARRTGVPIEESHVVVVGASGAIGRLASLMLARRAGRLTLVGNAKNPFAPSLLSRLTDETCAVLTDGSETSGERPGELALRMREMARRVPRAANESEKGLSGRFAEAFARRGERPPLHATTDLQEALAEADIVLVATSSDVALVDPTELRPGTLVCDVARPPNVRQADLTETGVLVFDGGLVTPPTPVDLGAVQSHATNLCWGCLGETMLLALARQEKDFSIGSKLSLADADLIAALAEEHGFDPAEPEWYGAELTGEEIDRFAAAVRTARARRSWIEPRTASARRLATA